LQGSSADSSLKTILESFSRGGGLLASLELNGLARLFRLLVQNDDDTTSRLLKLLAMIPIN
jgi:hypothetical protein